MIIDLLLLPIVAISLIILVKQKREISLIKFKMEKIDKNCQEKKRSENRNYFEQFEAYIFLRDRLDLRKGIPYSIFWSAAPDFIKLITEHSLNVKPKTILECSSGLTTVVLARCCQLNNKGEVFSLENGYQYVTETEGHIERYELSDYATVIHAPLEEVTVDGKEFRWYALDSVPDKSIDMLVIDGPSGFIQKHSRYPAIPVLMDKLSDSCIVFLDDAGRQDEREIVDMWMRRYPRLEHSFIESERGCSVLTIIK